MKHTYIMPEMMFEEMEEDVLTDVLIASCEEDETEEIPEEPWDW